MSAFFRDARLKIDRAKKHIADLKTAIVALEDTYRATIEQHPNTTAQSLIHEFPEAENALGNLSLIIGDVIHNLRSALDFAWYSTISKHLPDKNSDYTKFPVFETKQSVEGALHGIEVDARCKRLFDCIVSELQPYKGGHNSAIWTLHDLDISDKHLLLLELTTRGHIRGITVRDKDGQTHRGSSMAVQAPSPYIIDFENGIQIEDKGKLSVEITLAQAGIFRSLPVVGLLSDFSKFVLYTVQLLENLC
jgi:hypothetical protein